MGEYVHELIHVFLPHIVYNEYYMIYLITEGNTSKLARPEL